jgi:iron complex outermembrane receptor protein
MTVCKIMFAALMGSVSSAAMAQAVAPPAGQPSAPADDADPAADAQAEAAAQPEAETGGVEDIVVTATRREERLQDVPVSITALSAESVVNAGITEPRQLTQVVPGLTFGQYAVNSQPVIRGVGTNNIAAAEEPNVSIYIDGVYQPEMSTNNFDLLQIERVEVLRGPQGTLFGRNATGGLINIITPEPQFDPAGEIAIRYGNFDTRQARAYVTTGITDTLAIDLAALYYEDDGFTKDLLRGGMIGDRRSFGGRSKLLFQPADTVKIVVSGNYSEVLDRSTISGQPWNGNTVARSNPSVIIPTEPNESALGTFPSIDLQQYGAVVQATIELGGVDLQTASSYQHNDIHQWLDADASSLAINFSNVNIFSEYLSQEVRLLSSGAGRLRWVAGLYGFWGDIDSDTEISTPPGRTVLRPRTKTIAYAAFAEGSFDVTEQLKVTAGIRYSIETRKFRSTVNAFVVPQTEKTFKRWTPRVSVQYEVSPKANVYASYSTGFKSGLYNTFGTSSIPVEPETISAYEVGIKSDPTRFLRANLSAFYYDYKNLQVQARVNNGTFLQNAATAEIKGAEAEIEAIITPEFSARVALSLLDATYSSFPNALVTTPLPNGGNSQGPRDVSGNTLIRSPSYTANLGLSYNREFTGGALAINGNLFLSDEIYYDFGNRLRQPDYALANAEIAWTTPTQWRFALWGKNLTNTHNVSHISTSVFADIAYYDRPRTYGISVGKKF